MRWLSRRDYCCAELTARLAAKGFESGTVAACLEDLRARHYLDDERYARQFVDAHARRGHGPVRIRHDLSALGLSSEAADRALDEHGGWADHAREARERRFGAQLPGDWNEKARQSRFLQYRGFSNDDIRLVMGTDVSADS
ncbi:MAG TPA: regulatory protein RecX [Steroidobacteraceae bacterium]|nr:regulatory protein RecX [Steroidobacteraceae bacterium]